MEHIVFVIGNYKNGGVARRSTNLANEFAKRGYRVTILVTREISDDIFFENADNVSIVQLSEYYRDNCTNPTVIEDNKGREAKLEAYKKLRYFTKPIRKIDGNIADKIKGIRLKEYRAFLVLNPDSVYITFGIGNFERIYLASRGKNNRIIFAEKNASQLELPKNDDERKTILEHLSRVAGVVVQTEDESSYYSDYVGENLAVIHNPVKAKLPEPFTGERRKIITNFCRINGQKNLPLLFDAFEMLHGDYPDYALEVFGNTVEDYEKQLRDNLIEELNMSERSEYIKILPPCADVHEKVRDCSMFVSSSDFEGLSNSMIEAMAIGMPVVCTDCLGGGARELIRDGENGLLVPMNDAKALYKAMKRFIDDKELSEKCSKNAAKIKDEMSAEKIAQSWIEFIEKSLR